jgi:alkylhydroperoxidase/carboxymuconolactone decarboxylase family protein YurZ
MAEKTRELTDAPKVKLPRAAASIAQAHPDLWKAYQRLGELVGAAGPLGARERRLIHLAYALGSASEGAAHSHARRALSEGISEAELEHVAILSATTLGWPQAIRALTIVQDVTDAGKDTADKAVALAP